MPIHRTRHGILVLALAAAFVITTGVPDAAAKKKKSSVVATIDGKQRRWNAKKLTIDTGGNSVNVIATIKRPHRVNQLIRGLSFSCQFDRTWVFPVTPQYPQFCVVGYSEVRFSTNPNPKTWGGANVEGTVEVTFDSLEGNRLTGRFHGTLTSQQNPPNPSVTVEKGTFSIDIGG